MICPRSIIYNCNRRLKPLLEGSSWVCYKSDCNNKEDLEFYKATEDLLLTRTEFFERKKEE